jgi:hypothetical protein
MFLRCLGEPELQEVIGNLLNWINNLLAAEDRYTVNL